MYRRPIRGVDHVTGRERRVRRLVVFGKPFHELRAPRAATGTGVIGKAWGSVKPGSVEAIWRDRVDEGERGDRAVFSVVRYRGATCRPPDQVYRSRDLQRTDQRECVVRPVAQASSRVDRSSLRIAEA